MTFNKHETFLRGMSIRADKFLSELGQLLLYKKYDAEFPNIDKFIEHYADAVVFAEYQFDWLDSYLRAFYKQLYEKLGQHNDLMEHKSTWQRCPICNQRVLTILSPNDQVQGSRVADYRIFCYDCQWTWLIFHKLQSKVLEHKERESIYSFLRKSKKYFRTKFQIEVKE